MSWRAKILINEDCMTIIRWRGQKSIEWREIIGYTHYDLYPSPITYGGWVPRYCLFLLNGEAVNLPAFYYLIGNDVNKYKKFSVAKNYGVQDIFSESDALRMIILERATNLSPEISQWIFWRQFVLFPVVTIVGTILAFITHSPYYIIGTLIVGILSFFYGELWDKRARLKCWKALSAKQK